MPAYNTLKVFPLRCRPFSGKLVIARCRVDADGTVRVFDSVADYFTSCHRLPQSVQAKIRRLAAKGDDR